MLGHPSDTSLEVESPEKDDEEECSSDWEPPRRAVDLTWRDEVTPILESFTRRTPGSALETTDARLCWYFRDADPDFGIQQARSRRPFTPSTRLEAIPRRPKIYNYTWR